MGVRPCFVFLYHKESYVYRQAFFLISASEMSLDFHIPNNFLRSPFVEDVILFFFLFSTSTSIKFISFKKTDPGIYFFIVFNIDDYFLHGSALFN